MQPEYFLLCQNFNSSHVRKFCIFLARNVDFNFPAEAESKMYNEIFEIRYSGNPFFDTLSNFLGPVDLIYFKDEVWILNQNIAVDFKIRIHLVNLGR